MVGIKANLGGKVERDGETRLPLRKQITVARIRFARRAETRILAHRPEAAAVKGRVNATRVGVFTRVARLIFVVPAGKVPRRIEPLELQPRARYEFWSLVVLHSRYVFSGVRSTDVSRLYKRVKAKDRQEHGESPKHREVDQAQLWSFPVTLPLCKGQGRAGKCQDHKGQSDEHVKQPLRVKKQMMEQVSESTQSLPSLPGAGSSDTRYFIVRTNCGAVKYRSRFQGRVWRAYTNRGRTGAWKSALISSRYVLRRGFALTSVHGNPRIKFASHPRYSR